MTQKGSALQELLRRRSPNIIRLGLAPVQRLLARLGNPHKRLTVVHVAGTNGKGSVIAFLEAMLLTAGIPVAAFTSPHLSRFNERIRINGQEIAEDDLDDILTEVLSCDPEEETTFFELTTAAALLYFARAKMCRGLVLLETGLGGRLDATNVVMPCLCLIASIGLDHQDHLGPTLAGIAREKGGILKPGVPAVAAPCYPEAMRVIRGIAASQGVPLILAGRDFFHAMVRTHWRFRDAFGVMRLPKPALAGCHQYANAALAVAGAKVLRGMGYPLTNRLIAKGIASARWPGRLEYFPGPPPIWLDGAHNPDGVRALVRFLQSPTARPTVLIFSVLNNKEAQVMVEMLVPWVHAVFTVACGGERGRSLEELVALWSGGSVVAACTTVQEALEAARLAAMPSGRVVVTGSLMLVGEVRALMA